MKKRFPYSFDGLVVGMFAGAMLDCGTTCYFLAHKLGAEGNPVAAPLFRHSLIWVPVYLLSRPLLVPFLPRISRRAFALFFMVIHSLMGLNNLGGIVFGDYFLTRYFSVVEVGVFGALLAFAFFVWGWLKHSHGNERCHQLKIAAGCLVFFSALEAGFYIIGHMQR